MKIERKDTTPSSVNAKPRSLLSKSPIQAAEESPGFQRAIRSVQMQTLCGAGCEPDVLKFVLRTVIESDRRDNPGRLRGRGRNLKATLKNIRGAAGNIEQLGSLLEVRDALHRVAELGLVHYDAARWWRLPTDLRALADAIESAAPQQSGRTHPQRDRSKALFVAYVEEATGHPHDQEVSALISGALDNPDYSTQTHKDWRQKHQAAINSQRHLVPTAIKESKF